MTTLTRTLAAILAFGMAQVLHAVPIEFQFAGQVDSASAEPNAFGLAPGDQIFGSAFIPDADIFGTQTYSPFDGSLELSFDIGNVMFDETQDLGFSDFPTLTIQDGEFVDLNFFVFDFEFIFSAFDGSWAATFLGVEPFQDLVGTFASTEVAEPGTLALSCLAVLLLGWRLRRSTART